MFFHPHINLITNYEVAWMGRNFYDCHDLHPKSRYACTYAKQCIHILWFLVSEGIHKQCKLHRFYLGSAQMIYYDVSQQEFFKEPQNM